MVRRRYTGLQSGNLKKMAFVSLDERHFFVPSRCANAYISVSKCISL